MIFTFIYLNYSSKKMNDSKFLIISVSLASFIWIIGNGDNLYYFFLMDDIFNISEYKVRMKLIFLHFCEFLLYFIMHAFIFFNKRDQFNVYDLIFCILVYMLTLSIFAVIHNYKHERDKLKILNSNLIQYSFKERQYLISEERTRISQELHDSIGHSLMALSMNIRYLKALNDKEKIQREICEIDALVKESINTLRSTVYNLKELEEEHNLKEEIGKIAKKFNDFGIVRINFDCDIDFTGDTVEDILLTTIKEAITNSLKHGNPTTIDISLEIINDDLHMIIKDNGEGCKSINKSNGLNGITARIKRINGNVSFTSSKNKGFTIKVLIPGGSLND